VVGLGSTISATKGSGAPSPGAFAFSDRARSTCGRPSRWTDRARQRVSERRRRRFTWTRLLRVPHRRSRPSS